MTCKTQDCAPPMNQYCASRPFRYYRIWLAPVDKKKRPLSANRDLAVINVLPETRSVMTGLAVVVDT